MSYKIAFNTNGGEIRKDIDAIVGVWTQVTAATPGVLLPGRTFDGWVVTGHDRGTAVYSDDGGATETALDSDPAIVPQGKVIEVKNLAADGATVQLTARWRVQFGGLNDGCPAIEVAPFTPICTKREVAGSKPLTLDVPVPMIAPFVPPPECACFTFDSSTPTSVQVTMSAGNTKPASGSAQVEISSVGDCCGGKYLVTPTIKIDIPECVTADYINSDTVSIGPNGASITCTWGMKNCMPFLEMTSKPFDLPTIVVPSFCLAPTTSKFRVTYKLSDQDVIEVINQDINLTVGEDKNTGCKKYTLDDIDIELDMTSLTFENDGDVYKDEDGNLYIDGDVDANTTTWYGGGYGDRNVNNQAASTYSRGPLMRRGSSASETTSYPIPVKNGGSYRLTKVDGSDSTIRWHSNTKDGQPPFTAADGWKTGNLDICMSTGFQWDDRGIAMNLTTFRWNQSGVLSYVVEPGDAPIVAPGLAVWDTGKKINNFDVGGKGVSGLAAMKVPPANMQPGLIVQDGDGLRVFGADHKTTPTEVTKTTIDKVGNLEVFAHDGDFKFLPTNGKLVLNDEASTRDDCIRVPRERVTADGESTYLDFGTKSASKSFLRDADAHIMAVVAVPTRGNSTYWHQHATSRVWCVSTGTTSAAMANVSSLIDNVTGAANGLAGLTGDALTLANIRTYALQGLSNTAQILAKLRESVGFINNMLGTLAVASISVSRSGNIIGITPNTYAWQITDRRYTKPTT